MSLFAYIYREGDRVLTYSKGGGGHFQGKVL